MISFTVNAVPVAQPRHRVGAGFGGRPRAYLPADHPVHGFRLDVQIAACEAYTGPPLTCPFSVRLEFVMPRPTRLIWLRKAMPSVWCPAKPDLDNLCKSVLDPLTGIVWVDDAQVVDLFSRKRIAAGGESPHVNVMLSPLEDGP